MSDSGGSSTGGPGGFTQSSNPFAGLTNTDLRPGRRKRRPIPLLDVSWPVTQRRKGFAMRKDFAGLVDTLNTSVLEISASGADNREDLIKTSFTQFGDALTKQLDLLVGPLEEPLAKGLNHISAFASALNRMNQTIMAIKTGRPSYMIDSDSSMPAETLPQEISDELDRFIRVGIYTLKSMVNDSAELPEDEAALERAEKAGTLLKIEIEGGDPLLFKSGLPDTYHEFFEDPLTLLIESAELGREMTAMAQVRADELIKAEFPISDDVLKDYPEIFEVEEVQPQPTNPLLKAFPPKKKTPPAAANGDAAGDTGGGGDDGTDEAIGDGAADQGAGDETTDLTDDTPQDPIQMVLRLASMIVVIMGGIDQGASAGDTDPSSTIAGSANDPANVGLTRSAPGFRQPMFKGTPIEEVPLAKILSGEVPVDPTVADALEELEQFRKAAPANADALAKLRATVDRLGKVPAPATGVLKTVPVLKSDDTRPTGMKSAADLANEVDELRKRDPEGGSAAALLIRNIQNGGGKPMTLLES